MPAVLPLHISTVSVSPTGSGFTVTVNVKAAPRHPLAEVGVTVYTTSSELLLVLIKVSVIVPSVEVPVVSPVTFGLSATVQEKVFPVKVVIAVSSKSIAKAVLLHVVNV